jgi:alkanesulfonate monooxygenase SsuD/methylene tetrahydromethanopterin reductase-like flavin-dependent oxidoreductase (luciferase family)
VSDVARRLGVYVLPGRVDDPRPAIDQARTAEHLGLGTVWIGERYGTKDIGPLAGAIGQATRQIRIGTAITHFAVRHPIALASTAMTLQALTGDRFLLGVGRSVPPLWRAFGLPQTTNAVLTDPAFRLGDLPNAQPPPILLAAIGPKSLALAGRHFDGVILHPFLTPEAVARSAETVRQAAREAGRAPGDVPVYAIVVTAPDLTAREEAAVVAARAVTYFQIKGFGEQLAGVNEWETAPLEKLRAHPMLADLRGSADGAFTRDELLEVGQLLPKAWLDSASATGSASRCADRISSYLDAGADEVILHGSTPELLGPTLQHVREARDSHGSRGPRG